MPLVFLVRHGRTAANADGVLAGWTAGVGLDERGVAQADAVAQRLAGAPVCRVVASPLQRTQETASALAQQWGLPVETEEELGECRYGAWTGLPLKDLVAEPLWATIQANPSAATFPASQEFAAESIADMAARAVRAVRRIDESVAQDHGENACWVAVSHGDVIKAILADALGAHLDSFQRIQVDPASVSIVRYGAGRPLVLGLNGDGALVPRLVASSAGPEVAPHESASGVPASGGATSGVPGPGVSGQGVLGGGAG